MRRAGLVACANWETGSRCRGRRKALDLTQAELAQRVSCSPDLIQKIESDVRRPSRRVAKQLADCLGLDAVERVALSRPCERSAPRTS